MCSSDLGDRPDKYAGEEGSTVSPSGGGGVDGARALQLLRDGVWDEGAYHAWTVSYWGSPCIPDAWVDYRTFSKCGPVLASAAPGQAKKVTTPTPAYKKRRPLHGQRARASKRDRASHRDRLRRTAQQQQQQRQQQQRQQQQDQEQPSQGPPPTCNEPEQAACTASPTRKQRRREHARRPAKVLHTRPLSEEEQSELAAEKLHSEDTRAALLEVVARLSAVEKRAEIGRAHV